ncbi:MAG TPA: methionyl-tRNA formyltransferase [Tepidisphaeraceae bacterium]|nr:methionyl-tRNA formyltransferase [Tepidisphaeraceae bacterium]
MKIIYAGSGEFGLPALRALLDAGHNIELIVSQPDRPAGRGRHLTPTPIAQFAIEKKLPLLRTESINNESLPSADLLIVVAFGQKISPEKVTLATLGSINLHGSRLPKFRGAAPVNAAILAGDKITGNSIIRLAQKMDAGAILGQSQLDICELEIAGELHDRLAADGANLILETLEKLQRGEITESPQRESAATYASKLSRASAKIDWTKSAEEIARQIRGMYPWPGCRVRLVDVDLTLVRARKIEGTGEPGTILPNLAIATGTDAVEIVELQPQGKRPMPLTAFRNGHPWEAGMRLESL